MQLEGLLQLKGPSQLKEQKVRNLHEQPVHIAYPLLKLVKRFEVYDAVLFLYVNV